MKFWFLLVAIAVFSSLANSQGWTHRCKLPKHFRSSFEDVNIKWYPVRGNSIVQFKSNFKKKGAVGVLGYRYPAYYRWSLKVSKTKFIHNSSLEVPCFMNRSLLSYKLLFKILRHELGHHLSFKNSVQFLANQVLPSTRLKLKTVVSRMRAFDQWWDRTNEVSF